MRRAARVDANHPEIVGALVEVGAAVTSLAAVGRGVPDLLVSYRGCWFLLEVKDGDKRPSAQKLTEHQRRWQERQHAVTYTVSTPMEALEAVAAVMRESTWRKALGDDA
jgi:hypothetical protein